MEILPLVVKGSCIWDPFLLEMLGLNVAERLAC
jgi:hypothetical protein